MPCLQLPPAGNQSALNLPPRNALREAKPLTCHLWDVPDPPKVRGWLQMGSGFVLLHCCHSELGESFLPSSKTQTGEADPDPSAPKAPAGPRLLCTRAQLLHLISNVEQDVLNGFRKSLAKKRVVMWMKRSQCVCSTVLAIRQLLVFIWRKSSLWNSWNYMVQKAGTTIKYNKAWGAWGRTDCAKEMSWKFFPSEVTLIFMILLFLKCHLQKKMHYITERYC